MTDILDRLKVKSDIDSRDAAIEIERLRSALRHIVRPQYGLQGIQEDCRADANKYNHQAMLYYTKLCGDYVRIARNALKMAKVLK